MKLFKKKKDKKEIKIAEKAIEAMNFTPPDYQHTSEYHKRLQHPLEDARREIRKIKASSLVDESGVICDIRDPAIDAFCDSEIVSGRKQCIHNIGSILQIFDSINESDTVAEAKKEHLSKDLERIEKDIKKYEDMLDKASV